jgi:hypothetical protein
VGFEASPTPPAGPGDPAPATETPPDSGVAPAPPATSIPVVEPPTETPTAKKVPATDTPIPVPTFTAAPTYTAIPPSPTARPTNSATATATSTHAKPTVTPTTTWSPPGPECNPRPGKIVLKLDVPYIHQVMDIGSADGDWACGPTSVAMVLAYYGKLDPWDEYAARQVASPGVGSQVSGVGVSSLDPAPDTRHLTPGRSAIASSYAPYVTNEYTYNDHTYSTTSLDPRGNRVAGLYGTICPAGLADWGRMAAVFSWHGLTTKRVSTSWDGVVAALKRGHPVLLGNHLTAAGHVLVAVGYTANRHLIVNDPYGNRFTAGYGGNIGYGVAYRWECVAPHAALEVIGTYPPITRTPTQTLVPTVTSTLTPSPSPSPTAEVEGSKAPRANPDLHSWILDRSEETTFSYKVGCGPDFARDGEYRACTPTPAPKGKGASSAPVPGSVGPHQGGPRIQPPKQVVPAKYKAMAQGELLSISSAVSGIRCRVSGIGCQSRPQAQQPPPNTQHPAWWWLLPVLGLVVVPVGLLGRRRSASLAASPAPPAPVASNENPGSGRFSPCKLIEC